MTEICPHCGSELKFLKDNKDGTTFYVCKKEGCEANKPKVVFRIGYVKVK